ncbi:hypothetical protein NKI38_30725 [Mesorhizobium sp. M0621]|uniref:hypothetical protein n=1 Tax=Mesorhizobium sp. M0621 TaxID=2956974 RepID=UPI00333AB0E9
MAAAAPSFRRCYGSELTSNAILAWAECKPRRLNYIAPGKPMQTDIVGQPLLIIRQLFPEPFSASFAIGKSLLHTQLPPSRTQSFFGALGRDVVVEGGAASDSEWARGNVISANTLTMSGQEKGWFGWPQNDEYEAFRAQWADIATLDERKALARKMQRVRWGYVPEVLLVNMSRQ